MRIALIGYGKMGKEIEAIALLRGHEIVARVDSKNTISQVDFSSTELAIEFTKPDLALTHIDFCLNHSIPIVVGTTGWHKELSSVTKKVEQNAR